MKPPRNTKKSNPSTAQVKASKREYRLAHASERKANEILVDVVRGHSKEEIMAYGQAFVDWAKEELDNPYSRRLTAAKFWLINDIHWQTPNDWCLKYPEFKANYDKAFALIGLKREEGMMMRELSEKSTMHTQHMYSSYWREADKYHADLKKTEEQNNSGKVIYKLIEMSDV